MRRVVLLIGIALAALAAPSAASAIAAGPATVAHASALPPIHHVFQIVLENESAGTTFGPASPAPYLSQTLKSRGAYLPNYFGIGHASNDNYIALISGQAPNIENQADCLFYNDFFPGTIGAYGQTGGIGCVYPASVPTIASQLQGAGLSWRDYNESMGADPSREASACGHPGLGNMDGTQKATAADEYATRHNPFVYFHSIIDDTTLCDTHVVNLSQLPGDLRSAASTPNYVFITPDLCDDGHDAPCANGQVGGLAQADQFLRQWVPRITGSAAFLDGGGLLMIVFDEASTSDTGSCCGEIAGPGSPLPGLTGSGGGDVGAVLLSPCIAPGTVSMSSYNHYTALRSVEDVFGLGHIGYAQLPGEQSFGSDVFTRACGPPPKLQLHIKRNGRRIRLRWSETGATGSYYYVVQERVGRGPWRTLRARTTKRTLTTSGRRGRRYSFRLRAIESSGTYSAWVTKSVAIRAARPRR